MPDHNALTVLQVIPDLAAGGAERTTIEMAQAVTAAGGRALVASRGGRLEAALKAAGGELLRLDMATKNPFSMRVNASRLADIIRREGVSIIHARSRAPAWSALWAARRTGIRFITTYHGAYKGRSALKKLYNSVMARGDMVIANSAWIAEHIAAEHGLSPDRIVTIPRGVDLAQFDADTIIDSRVTGMQSLFGLAGSAETFVAIMPARMTVWKGHAEAIRAVAALPAGLRARIVLIFVGDAQGREAYVRELVSLAENLGIAGQTRILGHVDDVPAALKASHVMLAPSVEPEAFGRSAAEAGALGLPVIATDHGGARETVIHGVTGLRVPPGDTNALRDAIAAVMEMPEDDRLTMGKAAREYIRSMFSTTALQQATLSVYQSLLDQSRTRPR